MRTRNRKDKDTKKLEGKLFRIRSGVYSSVLKKKGQAGIVLSAEKYGYGSVRIIWLVGMNKVEKSYWFNDFLKNHIEV